MNWLNAAALAALAAGHAELMVALINRLHALPLSHGLLRRSRQLHELAILAFPPLLVWFVGLMGPRLLTGGRWSDLPAPWAGYLALCAVGAVGLVVSAVAQARQRPPAAQVSNHSHTIDIDERLGYRPIGAGRHRLMIGMPGNEAFRVVVSDKSYRLPRLPAAWDGLSIVHLTDLHYTGRPDRHFFEEVCALSAELAPDMFVFTGDLLDSQELIEWLPSTLGRLNAPLGCHFVLGNHDWYLDAAAIRRGLIDVGWHDVAGRWLSIEHRGHPLVITGTERPWMGRHPDLAGAPAGAFRLLLSHTADNLPWARGQSIDLMLSGHNHGGQVMLPLVGAVYSPSVHGCRYASGAFWQPPTLLYVSRGISGRLPFRFRCPPELTRLILRP
jgi:predicted MPP superfamily phosphohydrolase